jgi:hypothetical protein
MARPPDSEHGGRGRRDQAAATVFLDVPVDLPVTGAYRSIECGECGAIGYRGSAAWV